MATALAWHDVVGVVGVGLILLAYFLLQIGRWTTDRLAFSAANGLGAAGILVSLATDFNLSAFLIEAFWLAISILGLIRWTARRRSRGAHPAD